MAETTEERLRREYEARVWQRMTTPRTRDDSVYDAAWGETDAAYAALRAEIQRPLVAERDYLRSLIEQFHTDSHEAIAALHPEGSAS